MLSVCFLCLYNLKKAKEIPLKIWSTKIVSRLKNSMPSSFCSLKSGGEKEF